MKLFLLKFRQSFHLQWSNSGRTLGKLSCPKENVEILKNARLFYYRNSNFSCFCRVKCYLKKKNIICIEVDRFKTAIVRASRGFITGPVPKVFRETLVLKGVIGHPGPTLNWSVRHLRSLIVFLNLVVIGIGAQKS